MIMGNGKVVTIRDVAERAGVAVSTASRALGAGSASPSTRQKVRRAASELHFSPNLAARRLSSGRSGVVALAVPEPTPFIFGDAFISGMISRLSLSFAERGLLPLLALTNPDDSDGFERLLDRVGADGMVVLSYHLSNTVAEAIRRYQKPQVFIGRPPQDTAVPYVDVNNHAGGYLAGKRLLEIGRTRIVVIAGPEDMTAPVDRTEGMVEALGEAGLQPLAVVQGPFSTEFGAKAMKRLLDDFPHLDAVFAESDEIAAGAMQAMASYERQIRVPEDVAIIGFDDFRLAGALSPKLTSLAQPLDAMADGAVRMLEECLRDGECRQQSEIFEVQLKIRDSA
jgi:DNA-binding LacI/PurR family transcriptional regulator